MRLFQWLFGSSSQAAVADRSFTIRTVHRANELGKAILHEGNADEAIPVFEQGVGLSPNHLGVLFNLAVAYRLAGRFSDVKRICKKLLSINRMDEDAQAELDGCNEKDSKGSGEYETARKAFLNDSSSVALDRAGGPVFRDITFLAAGPASERSCYRATFVFNPRITQWVYLISFFVDHPVPARKNPSQNPLTNWRTN